MEHYEHLEDGLSKNEQQTLQNLFNTVIEKYYQFYINPNLTT